MSNPFSILRATVEVSCPSPAVILISSTLPGDGKSGVSSGLASAFITSGTSAAMVDGSEICLRPRAEIEQLFDGFRSRYAFTIIDGCTLEEGALPLAGAADGVVLTVRNGRPTLEADREANALLERFGATLIGVVATTKPKDPPTYFARLRVTPRSEESRATLSA